MIESRGPLYLREYGRNIQDIVTHIVNTQDRVERTRLAEVAVELMKQMNPNMTNSEDNNRVVWDHLHMVSDYKLDVDGPFPAPDREVVLAKPRKMPYPSRRIRFRHYGKNLESLISEVLEVTDEEKKKAAEIYTARLMKSFYMAWNKENVDDEVILKHLSELSNFQIRLDLKETKDNRYLEVFTRNVQSPPTYTQNTRGNNNNRGRNNNNNNNRRNKNSNNNRRRAN